MWLINNYNKNDTEYFEYSNHIYYGELALKELKKEGYNIQDYDVDLETEKIFIKPYKPKEKEKSNKEILNEWVNQKEEVKENPIIKWINEEDKTITKDKNYYKQKLSKYTQDGKYDYLIDNRDEDDIEYKLNKFYESHGIPTTYDYDNDYDDIKYKTFKKCKKPKIRNNRK